MGVVGLRWLRRRCSWETKDHISISDSVGKENWGVGLNVAGAVIAQKNVE
jgi:hypothetical protein